MSFLSPGLSARPFYQSLSCERLDSWCLFSFLIDMRTPKDSKPKAFSAPPEPMRLWRQPASLPTLRNQTPRQTVHLKTQRKKTLSLLLPPLSLPSPSAPAFTAPPARGARCGIAVGCRVLTHWVEMQTAEEGGKEQMSLPLRLSPFLPSPTSHSRQEFKKCRPWNISSQITTDSRMADTSEEVTSSLWTPRSWALMGEAGVGEHFGEREAGEWGAQRCFGWLGILQEPPFLSGPK